MHPARFDFAYSAVKGFLGSSVSPMLSLSSRERPFGLTVKGFIKPHLSERREYDG